MHIRKNRRKKKQEYLLLKTAKKTKLIVCYYINFGLSSKYVPNQALTINLVEFIDGFHRIFIIWHLQIANLAWDGGFLRKLIWIYNPIKHICINESTYVNCTKRSYTSWLLRRLTKMGDKIILIKIVCVILNEEIFFGQKLISHLIYKINGFLFFWNKFLYSLSNYSANSW